MHVLNDLGEIRHNKIIIEKLKRHEPHLAITEKI